MVQAFEGRPACCHLDETKKRLQSQTSESMLNRIARSGMTIHSPSHRSGAVLVLVALVVAVAENGDDVAADGLESAVASCSSSSVVSRSWAPDNLSSRCRKGRQPNQTQEVT